MSTRLLKLKGWIRVAVDRCCYVYKPQVARSIHPCLYIFCLTSQPSWIKHVSHAVIRFYRNPAPQENSTLCGYWNRSPWRKPFNGTKLLIYDVQAPNPTSRIRTRLSFALQIWAEPFGDPLSVQKTFGHWKSLARISMIPGNTRIVNFGIQFILSIKWISVVASIREFGRRSAFH